VHHLIVTRTDHLTHRRWTQLHTLQQRTGITMTMLWHGPPGTALATRLDAVPHRIIEDLDQAMRILARPADPQTATAPRPPAPTDTPARTAVPAPATGLAVPRERRAPCAGADAALTAGHHPTPAAEPPVPALAARLHQIAHPTLAGALATAVITGHDIDHLAQIRTTDLDQHTTAIKTHNGGARTPHHDCRLYAVPPWAAALLTAARTYSQLHHHPTPALFPHLALPTAREELTHHLRQTP
jgi:hypothetical protein